MPLLSLTVLARTMPDWFTTVAMAASASCADRATRPPSAVMVPLLVTLAPRAPASTWKVTRPSPWRSMATREPATRPTEAPAALMLPSFTTWAPASRAKPPGATLIWPWLRTRPLPVPRRVSTPALKSASLSDRVEATKAPVSMRAVGAKYTP